jgi:predicted O-methyltransferase YrrM
MDFLDPRLLSYCESFTEPETDLLKELNRQTHLKISSPRMLSGHLQGRLLSMLSKLIQPSVILEIGTYTGYSALCLAEGLKKNGKLITIDPNEETNHFAEQYFNRSAYKDQIRLLPGDARQLIPTLPEKFDLVFIDADKRNYAAYFDLVIDQTNPGGLIIADNVLWSGKVLDPGKDADTLAIHGFNQKIAADPRGSCLLLPVRDGLMLFRKT